MTEEDKRALRIDGRPTLNYPVLKPFLMRQLKNVIDSVPTLSVYPIKNDSTDPFYGIESSKISEILTITLKQILKENYYENVIFKVAENCFIGGKGVFKIRTAYKNEYDFEQKIIIEAATDPTMVFFDPRARSICGADGQFSGELCPMMEEVFKATYPNIAWHLIKQQGENYNQRMGVGHYKFEWFKKEKNMAIISDFYYKKQKVKTLYELNNGMTIERQLKPDEKLLGLQVVKKRKVKFTEIWHTQFCGDIELKKPVLTNLHHLPHVKCPGEIVWEEGKPVFIPLVQHAFDAQRTKNFLMNFFLFDALNHDKGKTFMPEESVRDQEELALRHPLDQNIVYYKQYYQSPVQGNELLQLNAPQYIANPPLESGVLEAATMMNADIEKILGIQFPSIDEVNLSGKALYNMADFMSASNEIFMQHLMESWRHVGTIIVDMMPNVLPPRRIGFVPPGYNPQHDSSPVQQTMMYHYNFPRGFYQVNITRGVNYKLQQQKNVEMLMEFGKLYPPLMQFLFTDGFEFMLGNMDFNNKEMLEKAYQNYQQKMQQEAAQSGQAQMQQMEIQERQQELQNQRMNAQAHVMKAQNDEARLHLQAAQLQHQKDNNVLKGLIETKKITSSDKKNWLDNLVKMEHIESVNRQTAHRQHGERG